MRPSRSSQRTVVGLPDMAMSPPSWALMSASFRGPASIGAAGPGAASTGAASTAPSVLKVLWSRWHQELGELAMEVLGAPSMVARGAPYDLDDWQRLFLFSRADTIYGGSDEIQHDIIARRGLGLPR